MPARSNKFQERLFEFEGAGPLLSEDVIDVPDFDLSQVSGNPRSRYPESGTRPSMVMNKKYVDWFIIDRLGWRETLEVTEFPALYRVEKFLDSAQTANTVMDTSLYEKGTQSMNIFRDGLLLERAAWADVDTGGKFWSKVRMRDAFPAGTRLTFWVC